MSRKFKFQSSKKSEKINLFKDKEDFIDTDILKGSHIEMFSNTEITIEGCCGVFEYTDNYIRLNLGKGAIILCGSELDISLFENKTITVKGKISSLEFCL